MIVKNNFIIVKAIDYNLLAMNPKMTVALSDLKYIQSEIQKILNLQKENTDEKKGGYYSIN